MTNYHQISLKETFSDCQEKLQEDIPSFFQLLNEYFNLAMLFTSLLDTIVFILLNFPFCTYPAEYFSYPHRLPALTSFETL